MNGLDVAARGLARRALQTGQTLASNAGAALLGTSYGISAQDRLGETVSILEAVSAGTHNAVLTGTNDDDHSSEVQRLIDQLSTAGGGTIVVPKSSRLNLATLVMKTGVTFQGTHMAAWAPGNQGGLPIFKAIPGAAAVLTTSGGIYNAGAHGIYFEGNGAGHGEAGITGTWTRAGISGCHFESFDGSAIKGSFGISRIEGNFADNCLLDRTVASRQGVLDITGSDNWIIGGEYTASTFTPQTIGTTAAALTSANLNIVAVYIRSGSGNNWVLYTVGEISDMGFAIAGSSTKLIGVRGDVNAAHGFEISGAQNLLLGCHGYRNGLAADATYADFHVTGVFNRFTGCEGTGETGDSRRVAYVVQDTGSNFNQRNEYYGLSGYAYRTAKFSVNTCTQVQTDAGAFYTFTDGDTTPSVDAKNNWTWGAVGTPFTVANFDDGVDGQIITIVATVAGVSLAHNATINNATRNLVPNATYNYQKRGGKWYEIPSEYNEGSATTGDVSKTITVGSDGKTQRWTAALTADRTATLSATNASKGDRIHVSREAAGAFNLLVVNGGAAAGTKAAFTAAGQGGIFEFDGTNWFRVPA